MKMRKAGKRRKFRLPPSALRLPPSPFPSSALGRIRRRCYSPALTLFPISELPASHGRTARMDVVLRPTAAAAALCALVAAAGCAPWSNEEGRSGRVSGVISPTEQIKDLRDLAKTAAAKNSYEKQMIEQQLAGRYQARAGPADPRPDRPHLGRISGSGFRRGPPGAVKDADNDVRMAACDSWGKRGPPRRPPTLAGVLNSDVDHDVRLAAARAMAQSHEQVAIVALGGALEDKDPAMQYRAVLSLREITGQDLGNDVNKWREYAKTQPVPPDQAGLRWPSESGIRSSV